MTDATEHSAARLLQLVQELAETASTHNQAASGLITIDGQRLGIIVGTHPDQMNPFRGYTRPVGS